MYESGQGVSIDYQKAIEWYKKSAESGNEDAIYRLETLQKEGQSTRHEGLDIFISHKSEDYSLAKKVYDFLSSKGLSVFLSEISIPALSNSEYSDEIDNALEQTKNMIVIATSRENVNSAWVKSEWQTFVNEKRSGRKDGNIVTLIDGGMEILELPIRLRQYQVLSIQELESLLSFLKS